MYKDGFKDAAVVGLLCRGIFSFKKPPDELDVDDLRAHLQTSGCGAIVSFIGITRGEDDGEEVLRLEFDAWQENSLKHFTALQNKRLINSV